MKAIVWTEYGPPDVLQLREVGKPTPKDNEVLVEIHAASVNDWDWGLLRGKPFVNRLLFGLLRPRIQILGCDIAGRVETVGRNVKQFQPGDEVFGDISRCGWGGFAEYVCVRENALVSKPASMTFEEAAAVPQAAVLALQGLRDKRQIQPGQRVLINGAGGGVGTFAVQIAKSFGAEVTGVDSTGKLDMVRSIGADQVIDYTKEDFAKRGETYDVIFDVVGKSSFSGSMRSPKKDGRYLLANPGLSPIALGLWTATTSSKKVITGLTSPKTEDLIFLKELIEAGKIESVIDRRYPLERTAEAHRYVETGHKQGNVVITVEHDSRT
jgi:NADPH:quinone reductase-like Zn-dependent oxidoreductase